MTETTPVDDTFRDTANLYLLTACDMTCSFCYASKGLGRFEFEQIKLILRTLRTRGAEHVNLTGGEPLMHPDVMAVVEHASELGFATTFFTSGSMMTEEVARQLVPHVEWVALSLDGLEAINRQVGRSKGHFEAALNAIRSVRAAGAATKIRVTTVATQLNVDGIVDLGRLLGQPGHRPDLWRIKQMVPTRRADDHSDELGISDEIFERATDALRTVLPEDMNVQFHNSSHKSGDTMCIHPGGEATVTIGDGLDMAIVPLGNVLAEPSDVFRSWNERRNAVHAADYNRMWQAPQAVSIPLRRLKEDGARSTRSES